jgi:hypothetical protein
MLSETKSLIYVLKPGDHEAGVAGDSINMGLLNKVAYLVQFAAVTGDAVLTVKSGATAGTETTAETFRYRLADAAQAAAGADLFGDWATSSSLTLTAATYANKLLVVEVLNNLTASQPWVTIAFSAAASALNASIVAVGEPRYKAHDGPTVI